MFQINQIKENHPNLADEAGTFFEATWDVPKNIKTLITTRNGGISKPPFNSLNLGAHVGDDPEAVSYNRMVVEKKIGKPVAYLQQTHSTIVVNALSALHNNIDADASIDTTGKVACGVMTADCLPVLFTNKEGTVVAAAHAGWRGLVGGILLSTIKEMNVTPKDIITYLGPAIGPDAFEVGEDVKSAFCAKNIENESCFKAINDTQYLADIYALARQQLNALGVKNIYGGEFCTVLDREYFFSYRREKTTGRILSAIWLA